MDLKELPYMGNVRHPWENVRARIVEKLLLPYHSNSRENIRVLDVGCGDAFISRSVLGHHKNVRVACVDTNFTEQQMEKFRQQVDNIAFARNLSELKEDRFDIVLLLDVLEHQEDDRAFLEHITDIHLLPGAKILITVPAFQFLSSNHDRFLGHFRRYNQRELRAVLYECGLEVVASGYLFPILLALRCLSTLCERVFHLESSDWQGVGRWNHGPMITKMIEHILFLNSSVMMVFSKCAITIPGLSAWALCKEQQ